MEERNTYHSAQASIARRRRELGILVRIGWSASRREADVKTHTGWDIGSFRGVTNPDADSEIQAGDA